MKFLDALSSRDATLTAGKKVSPTINRHGEISSTVNKVESELDDNNGTIALQPVIRLRTG
jgi:hypothetical protein